MSKESRAASLRLLGGLPGCEEFGPIRSTVGLNTSQPAGGKPRSGSASARRPVTPSAARSSPFSHPRRGALSGVCSAPRPKRGDPDRCTSRGGPALRLRMRRVQNFEWGANQRPPRGRSAWRCYTGMRRRLSVGSLTMRGFN